MEKTKKKGNSATIRIPESAKAGLAMNTNKSRYGIVTCTDLKKNLCCLLHSGAVSNWIGRC